MTPRELVADYLAAAKRGDWEDAFGYFADDILIHIPGRSEFAGDHRGKDAAVATSRPCATATGRERSSWS